MKRNILGCLIICSFMHISIFPINDAEAISIGSGSLTVTAGLEYDSASLIFSDKGVNGQNNLETWTIGQIRTGSPYEMLANSSESTHGDASIPGWEKQPADISIAAGESSVSITNNHDDPMSPTGYALTDMSTEGFIGNELHVYSMISYHTKVEAVSAGSFTFFVDYDIFADGSTTSTNDSLALAASVSMNIYGMTYDEFGAWEYDNGGMALDSASVAWWDKVYDGESLQINDFNGTLSITVEYEAGDLFLLRSDIAHTISGYSEDLSTAPVPEPTTMLLFGTGLSALVGYRRKQKK